MLTSGVLERASGPYACIRSLLLDIAVHVCDWRLSASSE